ncbi:hypothetical protein HID58_041008 [Brassica napus]|uniref:DUF668 domain-containing protein n=2 Tax=Brassica TaxID=3705 RepID=A0ABQ8B9M2_BRANA|nr:hypothetical protein HID58_041008 [Brassica napus]
MESLRLLKLSETTLGGSGVALHYANLIVVMEKMIKQPQLVGLNAKDDLCSMLPATVRSSLSSRLKGVGFRANALHYAAVTGVPVDSQSESGTPLIWDAGHDLLNHNVDPNAETEDNVTPLLSAVAAGSMAAGSMACLELLVKAGAKANVFAGGATQLLMLEIFDGNRPLEVASLRENIKIVETLFMLKTFLNPEVLHTLKFDQNASLLHEIFKAHCYIFHSSLQKQRGKAHKQKQDDKTHSIFPSTLTHKSYLLLKRSLCWLRLGQVEHALSDAKVCRELKPDWPKECFREGAALRLLQRFDKAANAFYERVNQGDH